MSNRAVRTIFAAIALAVLLTNTAGQRSSAFAQTGGGPTVAPAPAKPPPPPSLRTYLENLHYDVAERGALLVVAPDKPLSSDPDEAQNDSVGHISLGGIARRAKRMVVPIGSLTVLAPQTMKVIESNPGKANPFRGMRSSEALRVLMGSFTREQWQAACGENGIGFADMNDDEKLLFDAMLPTDLVIHRSKLVANPGHEYGRWTPPESIPVPDRTSVRLRLNREVGFAMVTPTRRYTFTRQETQPRTMSVDFADQPTFGSEDNQYDPRTSAYGVPLVRIFPNRLKPSQLDYASAQLNAPLSLGDFGDLDKKSTVGDLVARVSQTTRLDIVPDRRVRDLTVYVRGNSVRAGDLLQAIALSVTGTYRKVGATNSFVLTSDIEGTGTRLTRLEAWAELAEAQRERILAEAMERAAKQDPLHYLAFSPDDPLALPPSLTRHLDEQLRSQPEIPVVETKTLDLPPAVQTAITQHAESIRSEDGVSIDTSKIDILSTLTGSFYVPNVGLVSDLFMTEATAALGEFLAHTSQEKPKSDVAASAAKPTALDWAWLNAPKQERVLLFAPVTAADAKRLVAEAPRHGFMTVWLRVDPAKPEASRALLQAAVAEGKRDNVTVSACLSLLQNTGLEGESERTITNQTGSEFAAEYQINHTSALIQPLWAVPQSDLPPADADLTRQLTDHYANWRTIDADALMRRVSDVADTPGLAGLVFQETTPPGFIPLTPDDATRMSYGFAVSRILTGGEFGFTDTRRVAYLHDVGIDPIDIRGSGAQLMFIDLTLPFFPDSRRSPAQWTTWTAYREKENMQLMQSLYQGMRTARPSLPLWIDDRVSDYTDVRNSWFGTWDDAARLPNHTWNGAPPKDLAAAHAASKTALLRADVPATSISEGAASVASFLSKMGARALSEGWNGVVFDFSHMSADSAVQLLRAFPEPKTKE